MQKVGEISCWLFFFLNLCCLWFLHVNIQHVQITIKVEQMEYYSKTSCPEKQKRESSPKALLCEIVRHPGWNPTSTSLEGMASNLSPSQGISTRFNKLSSWIEHTKQNPFYSQTLVSFQATWTAFIKQIALLRWDCDVKKRCKITLVLHAWQKPRLPGLRTCQPADEKETCWQVRW